MAAPLLLRGAPLLRLRLLLHQHRRLAVVVSTSRTISSSAEPTLSDDGGSSAGKPAAFASVKDPPKLPRWDDPDFRKWKEKEDEIFKDIEPITYLAKEILHSNRYADGQRLTEEDEKVVVDRILSYHPQSEDKIGCGLDFIMVDRHPQFKVSRCLFVVRTDGGWIDFSYQKCIRAYIRQKYPSHAERFIKEHYKRGSS